MSRNHHRNNPKTEGAVVSLPDDSGRQEDCRG